MTPTSIYRGIMLECERRRQSLGLAMWKVDELAGTQDGYYAKAVHADAASGRQAQWKTLEWIIGALFPEGFDVHVLAKRGAAITDEMVMKRKLYALRAQHDGKTQRERMSEIARMVSDDARKRGRRKIPLWRRRQIARQAGRASARKRANTSALMLKSGPDEKAI